MNTTPCCQSGGGRFWSLIVGAIALASISCLPTHAVVLLDESFDTSPVDGIPNSITTSTDFIIGTGNPGSDLKVTGTGGVYSDPFGGAGNRSLVLHSFDGGCIVNTPGCSENLNEFPVVTWLDEFGDDPNVHRDGVIDFDIYLSTPDPNETWTLLDFRLGYGIEGRINPQTIPPDVVIWNQYQVQNDGEVVETLIFNNSLNQGFALGTPNENPLEPDVPFHVKYTLDGSTETFQWEMTNLNTSVATQITFDDSSSNVSGGSATEADWPWGFGPFGAAIDYLGYNSLDFQQDFGNRTSEAYIDNLKVDNSLPGSEDADFNEDGEVSGADFLAWQEGFGMTGTAMLGDGDANSDGNVDELDLAIWESQYGNSSPLGSVQTVPEPLAIVLILIGFTLVGFRRLQ